MTHTLIPEENDRGVHQQPGPRRRRHILLYLAPVGIIIVVLLSCLAMTQFLPNPSAARDMRGSVVVEEHPLTAEQSALQRVTVPDSSNRFEIASVGLNVPLGSMADSAVLEPPTFTAGYWIRGLGVAPGTDAASGTVFVIMHSLRGGGVAPGNYLYDTQTAHSKVALGAQVEVNGQTYTVDGFERVTKSALPSAESLWTSVPGRLVVITCLEVPSGGPSQENFIMTAHLSS